jgi:hypothetical protein
MSVSGVSSSSAVTAYTPPLQKPAKTSQATTSDNISISSQAQLLAKDGIAQAKDAQETFVQKANEKLYGMA